MAGQTYNLQATDLITLLKSTDQASTGRAILESVESAFSTAFPFSLTATQQTNGPANTVPAGYSVASSDAIKPGTQLELITLPTSTAVTGSTFPAPTVGAETSSPVISLTSVGGVVIGVGDQNVVVNDSNSGSTADTLIGGAGGERIISAGGSNILVGGSGANTLIGGSGADTLIGSGTSRLVAGSGANVLQSSTLATGNDTLIGYTGPDLLQSLGGNNRLIAGTGLNTIETGSGKDTIFTGGQTNVQLGTGAGRVNVTLTSTDTISAGPGADTVYIATGLTGVAESITGSTGALRVTDLSGSNTISGSTGPLTVVLGSGTIANASNQTINAGTGAVRIVTNQSYTGFSSVLGAGGADTVKFGNGQTLTISDPNGNVTVVFGDGHAPVKF